jgi:hypothetical protein
VDVEAQVFEARDFGTSDALGVIGLPLVVRSTKWNPPVGHAAHCGERGIEVSRLLARSIRVLFDGFG